MSPFPASTLWQAASNSSKLGRETALNVLAIIVHLSEITSALGKQTAKAALLAGLFAYRGFYDR
jgi:hypothetical protein